MLKLIEYFFKITTFFVAGYFIFDFFYSGFFPSQTTTSKITPEILTGAGLISGMAFGLGTINLISNHVKKIALGLRGWFFSLVLLFSLLLTFGAGILSLVRSEKANLMLALISKVKYGESRDYWIKKFPNLGHELMQFCPEVINPECLSNAENFYKSISEQSSLPQLILKFMTEAFFVPLGQAMFSLLAFFIASASFRAFRFRDYKSLALLISALIVLLGQNGFVTQIFPQLIEFRAWLLNNVSNGVFKVINISAIIGSLIIAVRIWLSLDKGIK